MSSHRSLFGIVLAFALAIPATAGAREHIDSVSFVNFHPAGTVPIGEPPLLGIFKQGTTAQIVVAVSGPHKGNVEQVRVSIAGGGRVIATVRTDDPIDFGSGIRGTPIGDTYLLTPLMERPCGRTEATARVFYRGGSDLTDSMPLYIDCSGPALRIDAPSGGGCVRPGERLALRWTASDDLGIKRLSTNLDPLIPVSPRSFTPLSRLEPTVSETAEWVAPHDRHGVIDATFWAEDWVGTKVGKGFTMTLDGSAPPAIGMDQPTDGQQASTVNSLTLSGLASDPGCGLDRIEIAMRRRGTSDPYRVVKTIRDFPSAHRDWPTASLTYRAELSEGTLAPGVWDLRSEAISRTGRRAEVARHIRVIAGPGLAPIPPGGRPPLPGVPPRPPIPPPR